MPRTRKAQAVTTFHVLVAYKKIHQTVVNDLRKLFWCISTGRLANEADVLHLLHCATLRDFVMATRQVNGWPYAQIVEECAIEKLVELQYTTPAAIARAEQIGTLIATSRWGTAYHA